MLKQSYEVEVIINGKPAKEYFHKGRHYIEGRNGTPFSIRVRNNSYDRKLFVPTVDGLSVMDGNEGDFESGGYIVNGYGSVTIHGWRTSDTDVATFYFSTPEKSYRKKMNKGSNLGVIGVAVFEEKKIPQIIYKGFGPGITTINSTGGKFPTFPNETWTCTDTSCGSGTLSYTSSSLCGSYTTSSLNTMQTAGSTPSQKIGTGWGDQKESHVTSVTFDRESSPSSIFEIYYNTREELEKTGINFKKEPIYVTPTAFPGQYCKPPQCSCDGINTCCSNPNCKSRN